MSLSIPFMRGMRRVLKLILFLFSIHFHYLWLRDSNSRVGSEKNAWLQRLRQNISHVWRPFSWSDFSFGIWAVSQTLIRPKSRLQRISNGSSLLTQQVCLRLGLIQNWPHALWKLEPTVMSSGVTRILWPPT